MLISGKCPMPHEPDAFGDVVPLDGCPVCHGADRVVMEVTRADPSLDPNHYAQVGFSVGTDDEPS